ncbi:hypothetical protein [uncultured Streptomyces sp.]|uniref:hypothetical protein n=1 Tax=uncultured Streptomyces sp. TaxID=174707 RepID=UPI002631C677|nr:hypothetical protein [uncultured Streptomyces sp.]
MTARRRRRPCDHHRGPHGLAYARPYLTGLRCDLHTPAALAGHPEPQPGPGWPAGSYLNLRTTDEPAPPHEQERP